MREEDEALDALIGGETLLEYLKTGCVDIVDLRIGDSSSIDP